MLRTTRLTRLAIVLSSLIGAVVSLRVACAQSVAELELLPPIGSDIAPADAVPETIVPPAELQADTPPLEAAVPAESGWVWTQPSSWFTGPVWDFGAELGINGSEGNAQAFSILAAANGKRETEFYAAEWDLKYGKSQNGGQETQHYALLNSRWDWKYSPTWFLYFRTTLEYDEFKEFDLRIADSGGFGYHLVKNEFTTLTGRLGGGASREIDGPEDGWIPEANFGGDFEHKLSQRQKVKLTTDYYPSFDDFQDYRLWTNAYWEILLDEQTNLSLKVGAVDRYDSTPNGRLSNDVDYFVTLLWKR